MDKIATKPYRFCMAPSVESNCSHRHRSNGKQTKKVEALDFQGLPCGGDSWTRTNDPIDVNDVHWATGQVVKLKCGREHT